MNAARRGRVCWIATTPFLVNAFLHPHMREISTHHDLTLAVNLDDGYPLQTPDAAVQVVGVPLERKISPLRDIAALLALRRLFVRCRYDAVHSFAPKAGLLGMLAAWLAGVPVRVHSFQGEVWASRRGLMRALLKAADWLTARLATRVLVVGRGERTFLEAEGVISKDGGMVLGDGSIAGIDPERFRPNPAARADIRTQLQVKDTDVLLLFLGRLVQDKGVLDLAAAFDLACTRYPNLALVFVGPDEQGIAAEIRTRAGAAAGRLRFVGYTQRSEDYLAAADIACLPSYREGFSTVILEAGACEVPVLASRIYGTEDALVDGATGRYLPAADPRNWANAIVELAADPARREQMGRAARVYVLEKYRVERLVAEMRAFYERALESQIAGA
jgi:glycosyltransferase involved in cell wall biosynthesis